MTPLRCPECGSIDLTEAYDDGLVRCRPHAHLVGRPGELQALHDQQTLENIGEAVDRVSAGEVGDYVASRL